jgi:hypothetical protein
MAPVLLLNIPTISPAPLMPRGERKHCAGHVELGEAPAGVEEAVGARAVGKPSDDLPGIVDATSLR